MDHCPPANVPSSRPVRESILKIDDHSWIIGDRLIISLQPAAPSSGPFWSDGADAFYTISELASQQPLPQIRPLSPTSRIKLVHDAGDANAAWKIGKAFLKVQKLVHKHRTREHTTLDFLHDPAKNLAQTCSIPRVLYHNEFNDRYYLITTQVEGETLEKAWPAMNEAAKQECVDQVVDTCKKLAQNKYNKLCGIDDSQLSESWMNFASGEQYSHEELLIHCKEIGMEESAFMLYHCDMGPTNVLVDLSDGCKVGIINWEMTGFVPKTWIRTKFCVSWAMNFDFAAGDVEKSEDWRQRVQLQLAREGFPEAAEAWKRLFRKKFEATHTE